MKNLKGLSEAKKDYNNFEVTHMRKDPYVSGVWMLKLLFDDGTKGWCIYNEINEDFVSEPNDFWDENFTEEAFDLEHSFNQQ